MILIINFHYRSFILHFLPLRHLKKNMCVNFKRNVAMVLTRFSKKKIKMLNKTQLKNYAKTYVMYIVPN